MDWPTLLKDYQSGLVGLLGFTGVIVTLLVNAYLGRAQHRRVIAHDRRSVRAALLAELTILQDMYERRAGGISNPPKPGASFALPVHVISEVYNRLLDKIGLLTPDETSQVINAYLLARELPENVRGLKLMNQIPADQDTEHFILVTPPAVDPVLNMHRAHLGEINKAIDALTKAARTDG